MVAGNNGLLWFVNLRARIASTPEDDGRVDGTVYYSRQQGARGSWKVAGRVPGQIFPGTDTFNFGYSMMALLGGGGGVGWRRPRPRHIVAISINWRFVPEQLDEEPWRPLQYGVQRPLLHTVGCASTDAIV